MLFDDVVVIVNARNTYFTGKKLKYKLYRKQSPYPGNLKEINAKNLLSKRPSELILRSLRGMLPKNKNYEDFLRKIRIYDGGVHDLHELGLPQFAAVRPIDYQKMFGLDFSPETHTVQKIPDFEIRNFF